VATVIIYLAAHPDRRHVEQAVEAEALHGQYAAEPPQKNLALARTTLPGPGTQPPARRTKRTTSPRLRQTIVIDAGRGMVLLQTERWPELDDTRTASSQTAW